MRPPSTGWQTEIPTVSEGDRLWTRMTVTFQDGTTSVTYSVSQQGAPGPPGPPGDISIEHLQEQFYLSTSSETPVGGTWSNTVPAWINGRYYWTRTILVLSDGAVRESTPVLANALNHAITTALAAQTATQNLQTTVSQHATAISLTASNITTLTNRMTTAEAAINVNANEISLAASRVTTLTNRVTSAETAISVHAGEIALRARQSDLNGLTGRVSTAETAITQNANAIALRATTATVNTLTSRVTTAEAAIDVLPTTIRLAVENSIAPETLVRGWERNRWNTANGLHVNDVNSIRGTHDIPVTPGEQFIGQNADGSSRTFRYFWYDETGGFISHIQTANPITAPANAAILRVSTTWSADERVEDFTGNIIRGATRVDMTRRTVSAATMLMQNNFINLRVAKGDVINQINISPEEILIAGNKIRITGQTTIDNAVIGTAQIADLAVSTAKIANLNVTNAKIANLAVNSAKIADAAITSAKIGSLAVNTAHIANLAVSNAKIGDLAVTNAKIATLDAAKINTGLLAADRIAAGSITSDKLTIANGFITNAMIRDATISHAKIISVDAGRITTGTLAAERIGAGSITANHLAANAIQVGLGGWTQSIRISPTQIRWFDGNTLRGRINNGGMHYYDGDTIHIGSAATTSWSGHPTVRGVGNRIQGSNRFVTWSHRTGTAGTFTSFLTLFPVATTPMARGLHLGLPFRTNGHDFLTSNNRVVRLIDLTVSGTSMPAWSSSNGNSRIGFGSSNLWLVTNGTAYNFTNVMNRVRNLINGANSRGWNVGTAL